MRCDAPRGTASVLFALTLTLLLTCVALTVDLGHAWLVRGQLQNAADAAALAGARSLDGLNNRGQFATAIATAETFSAYQRADGTPVMLGGGDVVLGSWNFAARTFTPGMALPYMVNAVQVTTRRTQATGNAVQNAIAGLWGTPSTDVTATAIAAGGSPASACGFPIAMADCGVLDVNGAVKCSTVFQFASGSMQNAGFTLFNTQNPNTPDIDCAFACSLRRPLPKKCTCTNNCVASSVGQSIRLSNGNNLSNGAVDDINAAVTSAGGAVRVQVPVVASNRPPGSCGSFQYNNLQQVVGYLTLDVTGATGPPNKSVTATADCSATGSPTPGGYLYGYPSTTVYVVQ